MFTNWIETMDTPAPPFVSKPPLVRLPMRARPKHRLNDVAHTLLALKRVSVSAFARQCDIPKRHLERLLRGKTRILASELCTIAMHINCSQQTLTDPTITIRVLHRAIISCRSDSPRRR